MHTFQPSPYNIAQKPSTSGYSDSRGGRFDEVHIVVIDAEGKISGNAGTILEKHIGLSKASNAIFSVGSPSYWRKYLAWRRCTPKILQRIIKIEFKFTLLHININDVYKKQSRLTTFDLVSNWSRSHDEY